MQNPDKKGGIVTRNNSTITLQFNNITILNLTVPKLIGNNFVKMIEAVAVAGGAGENCCLKLVGFEGMEYMGGRTNGLNDEVAG